MLNSSGAFFKKLGITLRMHVDSDGETVFLASYGFFAWLGISIALFGVFKAQFCEGKNPSRLMFNFILQFRFKLRRRDYNSCCIPDAVGLLQSCNALRITLNQITWNRREPRSASVTHISSANQCARPLATLSLGHRTELISAELDQTLKQDRTYCFKGFAC
ncbi:hypothetical protein B0H13DRAFT_1908322 [Mycena leptocephala]|nr:hypothetical protein B0H13DRAFT_1908322 [Mycena leptocephala]